MYNGFSLQHASYLQSVCVVLDIMSHVEMIESTQAAVWALGNRGDLSVCGFWHPGQATFEARMNDPCLAHEGMQPRTKMT